MKVFFCQLDIKTIYLKEEFGPKVFLPDAANNSFRFSSQVGTTIISLLVMGQPSLKTPLRRPSPKRPQRSLSPMRPSKKFHQLPGPSGTYSLKVVRAEAVTLPNGRYSLKPGTVQTYVLLAEDTANVDYINSEIQRTWGAEYIIVSGDGIPIESSSGTQGML